jgi:hypothetical protein
LGIHASPKRLAVPAGPDAELHAPTGEVIDARDLLGGGDRVALDDQADAAAHAQPARRGRGRRQRDEQVVRVKVLARQLSAGRIGSLATGRDVRVLGEEQRLVTPLLDESRNRSGANAVVRGEVADPEVHGRRV